MAPQIGSAEEDLNRLLTEKFTNELRTGYIYIDGVCLPEYFSKFSNSIENMEVREDDVWVCSFPKTGTTWTQEMVWCIANNLDFEGAKTLLYERFPFLDHAPLFDYRTVLPKHPELSLSDAVLDSVKYIDGLPSPRFIKTHLPYNLLPRQIRSGERKPKIVYVARNPKDACISYYHHCKLIEGYRGDFDEFCSLFLGGKLCFAPFWKNVLSYWERRDRGNILFIKYEDMKSDLPSIIRKVANFLGKPMSDNEVEILADHLSFESMKSNKAVNYEEVIALTKKFNIVEGNDGKFIRSGKVNQWKEKMTNDVIERFDKWTEENLKDTDLEL